jgi:hypothetical protein
MMLGRYQVPTQVEQITNRGMGTQKSLRCITDLNFIIPRSRNLILSYNYSARLF